MGRRAKVQAVSIAVPFRKNAGVRYLDTAWSYYLPSEPGTGTAKDLV